MMKSEDGLLLIAKSMDPEDPSMMTDVVKLMAALCLVEYVHLYGCIHSVLL